ncbi:chromosome segregation protein SMC [Lapidilactobacillus wuchangensis]|uniref:chromosome segregation protein SMC n=1 Tax=Lapidilactobacillus wuchangensis TaxID=2486001 RepID=UPI000F7B2D3C|nr:chromosome segregation protein SMC [Lapidilactobacillus wuchangensis]
MPLKSLIINGFKSFADKTTIEFTTGVTGIVGPNGSGKSNITEAIRWVMGEQSAKSLRGSHMPDVIFAGSALREPLNRAEVTLVFDNHDHELATEQSTVSVTRRLFRDGTSEFYLNQKSCRLRDISDLFLDAGMGKASFSIISQGRVEEIFNSKPEERRMIIEEVAGVYKYKQQKQQAESELATTNENLNRVADIYAELKGRIEPLRQQASLATDYQRQKKQYDQLDQQILALELADLQQQQTAKQTRQAELQQISDKIDQQAQQANQNVTELRQRLATINQQIETQQQTLLEKTRQQEQLKGQVSLTTERSSYHDTSLTTTQQQLAELATSLTQQTANLTATQANVVAATKQQQSLQEQLKQLQTQLNENQDDLATRLSQRRGDYIELLQQQTTNRNELVHLQDQQTRLTNQLAQQTTAQTDQADQLTKQEQVCQQLQQQLADLQAALDQQVTQLQTAKTAFKQLEAATNNEQQAWYQQLEQFQQLKARYQSLQEVTNDHSGFYLGVRAVLNPQNQLPGLKGAVADLLSVPSRYQVAIEQVLGAQLQQVVCVDTQSASAAIRFLKERRLGRATFLPLTTIQSRSIATTTLHTAQQLPGFLGVGAELIKIAPGLEKILQHLLGNVIVATDLAEATVIAKAIHFQTRIVTLEGDILSPGGAMTGGRIKQQGQGLLNRQQELQQQQQQLKNLQQELNQKKDHLAITKQQQLAASEAITVAEQAQQKQQLALSHVQDQSHQEQEQLARLQREQQVGQLTAKRLTDEQTDLTKQIATAKDQQVRLAQQVTQMQTQIDQLQERLTNFNSQKETLTGEISELKTQLAVVNTTLKNQQDLAHRQEQTVQQQTERQQQLQQSLADLTATASQSKLDIDAIKQQLADLTTEIATNQATLEKSQAERTAANQELTQLEPEAERCYQLQKQTAKEQEQVAVAVNSLKTAMTQRLTHLSEDYQLSFEAAYQQAQEQELTLPELQRQLKLVKLALADIGQVNLDAIAEFAEVNERYQFLAKQQADLIAARQQLLATMAEMDQEVSRRFQTTFTAVNQAFQDIFPKMFGGGKAELELTDENDPLTTGIEINAEPPGKKLQHLSLLSGGERALTAITLLFAILKVRPAPFSILDEVEASLDEANVDRFANYLQHYEQQTQFIVITHRKGTMVKVDRLYGVTMQESGVSKIISVSLTDIEQQIAQ